MILNNSPAIYLNGKMAERVYSDGEIVWGLPEGYTRCKYLEFSRKQRFVVGNDIIAQADDIITSVSRNNGAYIYNTIWGSNKHAELYYSSANEAIGMYYSAKILSVSTARAITTAVSKMYSGGNPYCVGDYGAANSQYLLTGNIYSFRVERDNKKIVDLIPCLSENGVPCFFDKVRSITLLNDLEGTCGYETINGVYVAPI